MSRSRIISTACYGDSEIWRLCVVVAANYCDSVLLRLRAVATACRCDCMTLRLSVSELIILLIYAVIAST